MTAKRFDLLATADWHIRNDVPVCRTDDYLTAQRGKMRFLTELQEEHECPLVVAGDVFHRPCVSSRILNPVLEAFPREVVAIPGQHDLPNHELAQLSVSGLYTLALSKVVRLISCPGNYVPVVGGVVYGVPFGESTVLQNHGNRGGTGFSVVLVHSMVWPGRRQPWPGAVGSSALSMLRLFPKADLVVTGDNHQSFMVEEGGRFLINPGSLMRMAADQADHTPTVYGWRRGEAPEAIPIPVEAGVVTREHIESVELHDQRVDLFVGKLKEGATVTLSFEKNMEQALQEGQGEERVQQLVWEAIGGEHGNGDGN